MEKHYLYRIGQKKLNIDYSIINKRFHSGWSPERILTTPLRKKKVKIKLDEHNKLIEYNGDGKTLAGWSKYFNISIKILHQRIHRDKWDLEKAFTTPVKRPESRYEYNGKRQSLAKWAEEYNMSASMFYNRIYTMKWTLEKSLLTPRIENILVKKNKKNADTTTDGDNTE